jgi:hypothetical protein
LSEFPNLGGLYLHFKKHFSGKPWENDLANEWFHEIFPGKRVLLPTPDEETCAYIASKFRLPVKTIMAMFSKNPITWMLPTSH